MTAVPKAAVHAKDKAFRAWLRGQPCIACGACPHGGFDRTEVAHLESTRYGDVRNAVSLCGSRHHREGRFSLHQMGRPKFEAYWQVQLQEQAERLYDAYLRESGQE